MARFNLLGKIGAGSRERLQAEREELLSQLADKESHLAQLQASLEENHVEHEELQRLQTERAELAEQLSLKEACVAQLQVSLEESRAAQEEVQKLQTEREDLAQQVAQLQAAMDEMQTERVSLAQKLSELESVLSENQNERTDLASLLSEKEQLLAQLQSAFQESQAVARVLNAECEEIKVQLGQKEALLESARAQATEADRLYSEQTSLQQKHSEQQKYLSQQEDRIKASGQTEALYLQLKKQFDEKNAVLQETRAQLFHVDTQLQKLQIEREQAIPLDPFPQEIKAEIAAIEEELSELRYENVQMQEIITKLTESDPSNQPSIQKKK